MSKLNSTDGIRNASSFILLSGYIISLGRQSRINSPRSGIYDVKWKHNRLPEGVTVGGYVTLIGQLITLDLGRAFVIIKAEALKPHAMARIKKHILEEKQNAEEQNDSGKV